LKQPANRIFDRRITGEPKSLKGAVIESREIDKLKKHSPPQTESSEAEEKYI